jgi:hypothetical protein
MEFSNTSGSANSYQLSPWQAASGKREVNAAHIEGRYLFREGITYGDLAARIAQGATIKRTPLTDEFTFQDFQEMYGDTGLVLFVKRTTGELEVVTTDAKLDPKDGSTLIALVDAAQDAAV